jgi:hypothetical protein
MNDKPLKLINLYGAPGAGKSATRSGIFWLMKAHHLQVEEIGEFAKYLVHTGDLERLQEEQAYCLVEQVHRTRILAKHYEYAVTDSPILLQPYYANRSEQAELCALAHRASAAYESFDFYLTRDFSSGFAQEGRRHTRTESDVIDQQMRAYLDGQGVECVEIAVSMQAPWEIIEHVCPGILQINPPLPRRA